MRITAFALAIAAWAPLADAASIPVTGWVVHNTNGAITVTDGNTNSPKFTAADVASDIMTLMAPFDAVTLANDGDYIKLTTTLSMANRSTTGVNTLNNNLRFGLFDGPGSPVVAEDAPNYGFFAQYANSNQTHLKVQAQETAATSPMDTTFTTIGSVALGNVTADPEDSSIEGANPTADYEMIITRSGGKLNITGKISGGDYLSTFAVTDHSSTVFPADGSFTFDRVGFYLGNNVNARDGSTFSNVTIETNVEIPEPGSMVLLVSSLIGIPLMKRRGR